MSEPNTQTAVLDASAVLALLWGERGGDDVSQYLDNSIISTINLAEVVQKIRQNNTPAEAADTPGTLTALGVRIVETFTESAAALSAEIWESAHQLGLSLGDRCCLALTAETPNAVAITADRAWKKLPPTLPTRPEGIRVICIR